MFYEVNPKISHKNLWKEISRSRKSYDYYPRGRVIKKRDKYIIFLNSIIATDEIIDLIIEFYELDKDNTVVHVDGSEHYRCYLDR